MVENLSIIPYLLGVVAMGWIPADCHDGIPKTRLHSNIWKPNLKWTGSKSPNILNNSSHWHWSFDLFNVSIFQTIWYSLVKSKDTEYFNDFNLGIFPGQEIYLWAQQFRTFYHREIVFAHHEEHDKHSSVISNPSKTLSLSSISSHPSPFLHFKHLHHT